MNDKIHTICALIDLSEDQTIDTSEDPLVNRLIKKLKSAKYRESAEFPANNIELFNKFPHVGHLLDGINDVFYCEHCGKHFLFVKGQRSMPFCTMACLHDYHENSRSVEDRDYEMKCRPPALKKKN